MLGIPNYLRQVLEISEQINVYFFGGYIMQTNNTIYRCDRKCPIHKNCFLLKVEQPIKTPIVILHKCLAEKRDIRIQVGGERPP